MGVEEDLLYRICSETTNCFLLETPPALARATNGRDRIGAFVRVHVQTMQHNLQRTLALDTQFRALSRPHFQEINQQHRKYSKLLELNWTRR